MAEGGEIVVYFAHEAEKIQVVGGEESLGTLQALCSTGTAEGFPRPARGRCTAGRALRLGTGP